MFVECTLLISTCTCTPAEEEDTNLVGHRPISGGYGGDQEEGRKMGKERQEKGEDKVGNERERWEVRALFRGGGRGGGGRDGEKVEQKGQEG